jgi:hypothetical protein
MTLIEFIFFVGALSVPPFVCLFGMPHHFALSVIIGFWSGIASLLVGYLYSHAYRLLRKRPLQNAPVAICGVLALLVSVSVALYVREQHFAHKSPPNTALEPTPTAP